jgi:hypothetical protein
MISSDNFARELFEDAKQSLFNARQLTPSVGQQRHLRHALLSSFSFLELQIELIAKHFEKSHFFDIHEKAIINQREIVFDRGVFKLKATVRYYRLSDRMHLLQHKFKAARLTERQWWQPLMNATDRRNSVAHPREAVELKVGETESDLLAALNCASDLFEIVFGKALTYAAHGVKPKSPSG